MQKVFIVFLLSALVFVGFACGSDDPPSVTPEGGITDMPLPSQGEMPSIDRVLRFKDVEPIVLVDVTGGNASGEAWIKEEDGTTYHKVMAVDLPELEDGYFYEGWLTQNPSALGFFSTGEMYFDLVTDAWTLEYDTEDEISAYPGVVITVEPDDGDPAPAEHILEGTF